MWRQLYYWGWDNYQYTWILDSDLRFVYDGWNVVQVLNGRSGNAVLQQFTWGLDVSGSLQGAGGIGGLLAWSQGTSKYWYFYDGNGNVVQVMRQGGTETPYAKYEYDPFGGPPVVSGGGGLALLRAGEEGPAGIRPDFSARWSPLRSRVVQTPGGRRFSA